MSGALKRQGDTLMLVLLVSPGEQVPFSGTQEREERESAEVLPTLEW